MEALTTIPAAGTARPFCPQAAGLKSEAEKIQAVFFDVDGTLLDPYTHALSESTRNAIAALKAKGIKVGLATARSMAFALAAEGMEEIDWDCYVVCAGAQVFDGSHQCIYDARIPAERQKVIFETAKKLGIPVFYYTDGKKATFVNGEMADMLVHFGVLPVQICDWDGKQADMLTYCCRNHDEVLEALGPVEGVQPVKADVFNIDFFPAGCDKGKGIAMMMKHWNLDESAFMAFGDSMGDAPMLAKAALGAAMPWSRALVKSYGNVPVSDYGCDTIAHTLQAAGLI